MAIYTNSGFGYNIAILGEDILFYEAPTMEVDNMPVSKAQQASVNKYVKNNYDRINVTMPKGKKETIQDFAQAIGYSVNAYINEAIDEKMERDKEGTPDA